MLNDYFTFDELCKEYNLSYTHGGNAKDKIKFAEKRKLFIEIDHRENNNNNGKIFFKFKDNIPTLYSAMDIAKLTGITFTEKTSLTRFLQQCQHHGIILKKYSGNGLKTAYFELIEGELSNKNIKTKLTPEIMEELITNKDFLPYPKNPDYYVNKEGKVLRKSTCNYVGGAAKNGYLVVCGKNINNTSTVYRIHRMVLETFNPIDNPEDFVVDHINGIRTDNRLENLRWVTQTENFAYLMTHRGDLNKELTRIINKMGYDKTLELLKTL